MSLFHVMSVSASGLSAQRARAQAAVENLANAETTRTSEGGPYRRKDVIFAPEAQTSPFSSVFARALGPEQTGVGVAGTVEDLRDPVLRYQPGHPDANEQGYVAYPNINPAEEMVDLMGASRGFQANVSALAAVKDMVAKSIDLLR
jgi:flagellar basal-body rod protein FlgC